MATAATAELISGVPKHAISCPCFSCSSSAFVAPACCAASDQAPRYLTFGRTDPLAAALLGQRICPSLLLGMRCPARCATGSARGVALRDPHDRPLVREGGQGIWLQARRAGSCPLASRRSSAGLRWPAGVLQHAAKPVQVRVILLTPQSQPPQGPHRPACGPAPRPRELLPRRPRPPAGGVK